MKRVEENEVWNKISKKEAETVGSLDQNWKSLDEKMLKKEMQNLHRRNKTGH